MFSQVEAEGDVATAFTLARILSNIPLSRGGPTSVVIFDIHALQVGGLCLIANALQHLAGMAMKAPQLACLHKAARKCHNALPALEHIQIACRQERFYFGDTVLPLFESGIPLLRKRLAQLADRDNVTIAYPDEGAWKRFKYQFDEYPEACIRHELPFLAPSRTDAFCRRCLAPWQSEDRALVEFLMVDCFVPGQS